MDTGVNWSGAGADLATLAKVRNPSELVMVAEKGLNGDNVWGFPYLTDWCWQWDGGLDTTADVDKDHYEANSGGLWGSSGTMPRYRHNGTSNFLFVDGHVKAIPRGRISWQKNIWGNKGLNNGDFRSPENNWYPSCGNYKASDEP